MFDKIYRYLVRLNQWIYTHWRLTTTLLVAIILMQQCTINRLRWEVEQITTAQTRTRKTTCQPCYDSIPTSDTSAVTTDTVSLTPPVPTAEESNNVGLAFIVVFVVLACAALLIYMHKNAIPPVGLRVRGKLYQAGGDILYDLTVKNTSKKEVEVSEAMVNFGMSSGIRRFRAGVATLPMTLQPGTSFATTIKITGLVMKNAELRNAHFISMSAICNGKRRTTLPRPVRIKIS